MRINLGQKQYLLMALQSYLCQLRNAYSELNQLPEIQSIIFSRRKEISSLISLLADELNNGKEELSIFDPKDAAIIGIACCIDCSGTNIENIKPYITDKKLDQCVEAIRNIMYENKR